MENKSHAFAAGAFVLVVAALLTALAAVATAAVIGMTLGVRPLPSSSIAQKRATVESTPTFCPAGLSLVTNGSYRPT